ncbi:MAG: hypothetical protein OEV91_06720 [Desulfobulbaceae bacterium]|nr:hypothetical protein [Desulfobulbaceae bacterium]
MAFNEESYTHQVRKLCWALGVDGKPFTLSDLVDGLMIQTAAEQRKLVSRLRDLKREGTVQGVGMSLYRLAKGPEAACAGEIRLKMWKVLRARRTVHIDDLVELAGASREYAKEWLETMARHQVVRAVAKGRYLLIVDRVEMPRLADNAQKLRRLRARQKALSKLGEARVAIDEAEKAINEMGDDDGD